MREIIKSISKNEWRFIGLIILAVMILTNLPYLYGWLMTPPQETFIGWHAQNTADYAVYLSYVKQVIDGHYLLADYFTSEPQNYQTLNIAWLAVGLIGRALRLTPPLAYHLSRLLFTPILLLTFYIFLAYIFSETPKRKISYILASFGSGLGLYAVPLFLYLYPKVTYFEKVEFWPLDLASPKINIFASIYQSPHLILSWAFMLLLFLFSLLAFEKKRFSYCLAAGLLALVFFNFHPYYVFLVFFLLSAYGLYLFIKEKKFDWRLFRYFIIGGGLALISIAYHWFLIRNDSVIGIRSTQNLTLVVYFLPVAAGFGLFLPLALYGFYHLVKKNQADDKMIFLALWAFINFVLLFLPTPFQAQFYEGLFIPLAVFSAIALAALLGQAKERLSQKFFRTFVNNKILWAVLFIVFFALTNIFNLTRDFYYYSIHYPFFYLDADSRAALGWLDRLEPKPKVVLTADYIGHLTPGFTGQKVFYAHGHETLYHDSKRVATYWFYGNNASDPQKELWLKNNGIDYVYIGGQEKNLGSFSPEEKKYLKLVFDSPQAKIYQVVKE